MMPVQLEQRWSDERKKPYWAASSTMDGCIAFGDDPLTASARLVDMLELKIGMMRRNWPVASQEKKP